MGGSIQERLNRWGFSREGLRDNRRGEWWLIAQLALIAAHLLPPAPPPSALGLVWPLGLRLLGWGVFALGLALAARAAWNLGASEWVTMKSVVIPFTMPSIIASLCLTAAVSFDEFAVAWFVSGLNKTVPVVILEILTGNIDPQVNAIGSAVFLVSITLVVIAQMLIMGRARKSDQS